MKYRVTLWRYPSSDREVNAVNVSVFYFDETANSGQQALKQAKSKFNHSVYDSHVSQV